MRCPSCRANNLEGMLFCARCGRALIARPDDVEEAAPEPRVVWKAEDRTTQEYLLSSAEVTIGRVAGNDIILPDPSVSRQHARIVWTAAGCTIEDLGSLNGTFLNGIRIVTEQPLRDGDVVEIGRTAMRVFLPPTSIPPARLKEERTHSMDGRGGPEPAVERGGGRPARSEPAGERQPRGERPTERPQRHEPAAERPQRAEPPVERPARPEPLERPARSEPLADRPLRLEPTAERPSMFEPQRSADPGPTMAAFSGRAPAPSVPEPAPAPWSEPSEEMTVVPQPERPPSPAAWLVSSRGERLPISDVFTIGRSDDNDLALDWDRQVSRHHARLRFVDGELWIEDLASSNGTFVNEERLAGSRRLASGDTVRVGSTILEVDIPAPEPPTVVPEEATLVAPGHAEHEPEPEPDRTVMATPEERAAPIEDRAYGGYRETYQRETYQDEVARAFPEDVGHAYRPEPEQSDGTIQIDPSWPVMPEPVAAVVEPSHEPRLVINWGPQTGRRFSLTEPVTVIGRAGPNADYQIVLEDRAVSRPHARITLENGRFIITDLESANGTWVNYQEVRAPRELHDGDVIKVGATVMVFRAPSAIRPSVPEPVGDGQIITVFSLKGGVGTTTLATNLALLLQRISREPVALVDTSLERGAATVHLNITPKRSLADIAGDDPANYDTGTFRAVMTRYETGLDVLPAPPSPQLAELVTAPLITAALALLRRHYRWIVVDTTNSFSEVNLSLFDHSDLILVLMGPDVTSIKVTQATLDIFAALFVPGNKRVLVLNQPTPYAAAEREMIEKALGERVDLVVPHGGEAFARAADAGRPAALAMPDHPTVQALDAFARKLVGLDAPAAGRPDRVGWAGRFKRMLGV